jgi:hypothetical protein
MGRPAEPEAAVESEPHDQEEHPRARAWPCGGQEGSERLDGLGEVHSTVTPDGEFLLGVAAVGLALDVASMGPGESVQEHYLGCMLGSQHHAAMQRLEGRERQEDIHRPVAVGGGSRPPQDRAAPPVSNRVAHMGLPLLRR